MNILRHGQENSEKCSKKRPTGENWPVGSRLTLVNPISSRSAQRVTTFLRISKRSFPTQLKMQTLVSLPPCIPAPPGGLFLNHPARIADDCALRFPLRPIKELARHRNPSLQHLHELFRVESAMPRNPAGKVLKTELRIRFGTLVNTGEGGQTGSEPADPG